MVNDKISDTLIRIKNAGNAGKEYVAVPYSGLKLAIVEVLHKKGYVSSVNKKGKKTNKIIEIGIAYEGDKPKMQGVERVSRLSRRVYYGFRDIRSVRNGHGDLILSTPKGILSGEDAKKENVGGEVLFKIW